MNPITLDSNQELCTLIQSILKENNIILDKTDRILDFGCGSGRHTYEFLNQGYQNCFGYDIKNYLTVRHEKELSHFSFSEGDLPFKDNMFDLIFSTQVLEHVADYPKILKEMSRILKPGGVALHIFPPKWMPIEPHIHVPFGGIIKRKPYYKFWAALGIRNEFQKNLSTQEIINSNYKFARENLNYLSGQELKRMFSKIFSKTDFCELDFLKHAPGRAQKLYPLFKYIPGALLLYRTCRNRVVLLRK
ncbi:MAG TPA: hypothetical protein DD412_07420 [Holosporales bacterium]|nr:hypothetical protein [Holosporales bacterium]